MPFCDGIDLIEHAMDAETNEKLYMRWIIGYQYCMTFEEFKGHLVDGNIKDDRTAGEILETVKGIIG